MNFALYPQASLGPSTVGWNGMFYSPDMGDLPDFDLPDDLELPNIAQVTPLSCNENQSKIKLFKTVGAGFQ